MENKILVSALEMFMKYGVKSVSMDDISRMLGISKKTLYQFIDNKKDLVKSVIIHRMEEEEREVGHIIEHSKDAIHEMVEITRYVHKFLRKLKPSLIYDLQKYHKEVWGMINNHHKTYLHDIIKQNIERGQSEGYYRDDLSPRIISNFYTQLTLALTDESFFPLSEFTPSQLHKELVHYHMYALANSKGRKKLKSLEF